MQRKSTATYFNLAEGGEPEYPVVFFDAKQPPGRTGCNRHEDRPAISVIVVDLPVGEVSEAGKCAGDVASAFNGPTLDMIRPNCHGVDIERFVVFSYEPGAMVVCAFLTTPGQRSGVCGCWRAFPTRSSSRRNAFDAGRTPWSSGHSPGPMCPTITTPRFVSFAVDWERVRQHRLRLSHW